MWTCARLAALGVLLLTLGALAIDAGGGRGGRSAHAPARRGHLVRATDPGQQIRFALTLRLPRARAAESAVAAVQDPRSPHYRHFIAPAAFGARFGVSLDALRRATRRLALAGVRVTAAYPQRTSLQVRGSAAAVNRLLRTRLADFVDPAGRPYHRPLTEPTVPAWLRRTVRSVSGLTTRRIDLSAAVPSGGLGPRDAAAAYDVQPLIDRGLHGEGETIAIFSLDTFRPEDVAIFDRQNGIAGAPAVEHVPVGGGPGDRGGGMDEVNLDIDVIRGLAPKARILNYEAPSILPSFADIMDRIVADRRTDIVSISYGYCELRWDPAELARAEQSFRAAAASGISIFVSSGDQGAYECQRNHPEDQRLSVPWPGSSPSVTSVGGTNLSVRRDGTYLQEAGWESVLVRSGGGGGVSALFPRPSWQSAPGVEGRFSSNPPRRQMPDVAASGDPASGFAVVFNGEQHRIGGTSASTPFWSGSMLLTRQFARRQGIRRIGPLNPILYRLASTRQPFPPFHDVALGGNRYYDAGRGWDYSTGLGTPDVYNLARDVVAFLKRNPV